MKNSFTYNFVEKTIIGSNSAIKKANKGKEPEYSQLTRMLAEHPDFTVRPKDIQKNEEKKTYGNLTIARMEEYIRTQYSEDEVLSVKLIEFKAVQKVAETKGAKYPLTKKWFLANYPSFKENEITEDVLNALQKELAAKAKEESQVIALEGSNEKKSA